LLKCGLKIIDDFLSKYDRCWEVVGVFQTAVTQPEDVKVLFVPLYEVFVVE